MGMTRWRRRRESSHDRDADTMHHVWLLLLLAAHPPRDSIFHLSVQVIIIRVYSPLAHLLTPQQGFKGRWSNSDVKDAPSPEKFYRSFGFWTRGHFTLQRIGASYLAVREEQMSMEEEMFRGRWLSLLRTWSSSSRVDQIKCLKSKTRRVGVILTPATRQSP